MNLELRKAQAEISGIIAERQPLPVEMLVPPHARRVSVAAHHAFRRSLAVSQCDPLDDLIDDEITVDPYNGDPPSKRKDKELNRVLSILDELERGNG
jgi:hypothetical protein